MSVVALVDECTDNTKQNSVYSLPEIAVVRIVGQKQEETAVVDILNTIFQFGFRGRK